MGTPSLLPLFALFAVACAFQPGGDQHTALVASAPPVPADQRPSTESYLFTDSLTEIRFQVSTHMHLTLGAECQVDGISLTRKGEQEPYDRIAVEGMRCPCPMPDGQFPAVQLMDFDFDGHRDIRVMRMAADLTNSAHNYWLWDPGLNTYRRSAMLDSIQQPLFDNERKMVSSQWYDGRLHRGGSTFRYMNGRLTMVSNMEKFKEGDHERWVVWGMKDGVFQPVSEKQVPLPK